LYDYRYVVDPDFSLKDAKRLYPCHCGAASCRGTIARMPKPKKAGSKKPATKKAASKKPATKAKLSKAKVGKTQATETQAKAKATKKSR
jgi:hypothetical protein